MRDKELIQKIMKKIENEEIKMKPKWWFLARKNGLLGITTIGILLASILLSITLYLARINTPLELWDYGSIGVEVFFKDFPYLWLISGFILVGGTGVLMSKIGDNYKKATLNFLAVTAFLVLLATVIMTVLIKFRF